ncbi:MAG: hypothetical protein GXX96_14960 [Planctomycetaceae bacterium]|nr:hypothetical protein [Planctomycetaceae bacterium]
MAQPLTRTEDHLKCGYRLWLARNMGGGYQSIHYQPLTEAGSHADK